MSKLTQELFLMKDYLLQLCRLIIVALIYIKTSLYVSSLSANHDRLYNLVKIKYCK